MILRRRLLVKAFQLFDVGLMILAVMVAALVVLREGKSITIIELLSMRVKIQNFAALAFLVLAWRLIFTLSRLYSSRRLSSRRGEIVGVVKATSLGTSVILVGAIVFRISLATPLFLATFWILSTSTAVCSRLILRVILAAVRRHGRNLREIVIVGTNKRALEFAQRLVSHPELGYRIAGFVDQDWCGMEPFWKTGYTLASDFDTFPQLLRSSVIDEVAVALPIRSMHDRASRITALCEEQGITVRVLTSIFDLKIAHSSAEELEGAPVITHSTGWVDGWPIVAKRFLDFTISLFLIVFLSPILAIIAIVIKLNSPGSVFFVQKRVGLNKRHFKLYKFRTMEADAEARIREIEHLNEVSGPVFKIKNDPRITSVGRFLRKASLDELPQFFNVLMGDMSLVGPRPLPLRDYEGFNQDWQRRRFSVRPGITCLWQTGGRNSIPFEKWMELDLQYIDEWSLWLDFRILLRTIPTVLKGSGAA